MVERMAADVGQYSHTRKWQDGTLTNTRQLFGSPVRLPDAIVFLSTLTSVLERHPAVIEAAKMAIPTIGIVDSNSGMYGSSLYTVPNAGRKCEKLEIIPTLIRYVDLHGMSLDPNYITYPIPGNDDSTTAIRYYMRMFCDAINRGKNARHGIDTAPTKETESPTAQEPVKLDNGLVSL
uniref:30S ribosomal protein S2 n=1 Tax=Steinernema glaseri TaxID=37863 RepID=A0A1I7YTF8_9BILA